MLHTGQTIRRSSSTSYTPKLPAAANAHGTSPPAAARPLSPSPVFLTPSSHRLQPRADLPRPHPPTQRSFSRHPSLLNNPRSPPPGCPAGIRRPNNRGHGPALARHPDLLFPGPHGPTPPRRRRGRLGLRL
ncbi:hypothetical protein KSP39_PZI013904 [Platanthera zijinensis]|uniref:Uncharacterized protein n=1 Tax=Platanthera zijinensis TaxID=2320716 RepID=A0AAP0BE02_9ASPA